MNELQRSPVDRLSRSDRRVREKHAIQEERFIYKYFLKSPAQRDYEAGVTSEDKKKKEPFNVHMFIHNAILVFFILFTVGITSYMYTTSEHPVVIEAVPHNPNEIIHLELKSDLKK